MNVNVTGPSVALEFEVMMFDVLQAVTHLRFSRRDFLGPDRLSCALDRSATRYGFEVGVDHKFRAQRARANFRSSKIQNTREDDPLGIYQVSAE